jgi:hypothetical protein
MNISGTYIQGNIFPDVNSAAVTFPGTVTIAGDLTVNGTTTTVNSTTLDVTDKNITVNNGGTTALSGGSGINIEGDSGVAVGYWRVATDTANFEIKAPTGFILTLDVNASKTMTIAGALNVSADSAINQDVGTAASPTHAGLTLTGLTGVLKASAGVISGSATTADLTEGANLYYTNTRADARIAAAVGVSVQAYDVELASIAGLVSAADRLPYFTGSGTASLATFTSFGRSLVDDADATAGRSTLGVVIGTNVQAYDAELAAIAGLTSAANALPYFTGSGTAAVTTLTSAARTVLDDTTVAAMRLTLGIEETFIICLSDETTAITAGTAKVTMRVPYACTLTRVRASLTTASTSGIPTVDINEGGATVLSTKLTIDANELTSTTAATAAVISDSTLADDAELTFDIDVAGTGAKGLKVAITLQRTA